MNQPLDGGLGYSLHQLPRGELVDGVEIGRSPRFGGPGTMNDMRDSFQGPLQRGRVSEGTEADFGPGQVVLDKSSVRGGTEQYGGIQAA